MLDSDRIDCIDLMLPFLLLQLLLLLLPLRLWPIHDRRFAFDVFIVLKAQRSPVSGVLPGLIARMCSCKLLLRYLLNRMQ